MMYHASKSMVGSVQYFIINSERRFRPCCRRFFIMLVVTFEVPGALSFFMCLIAFSISFFERLSPRLCCTV